MSQLMRMFQVMTQKFKMSNKDENVKQLRSRYNIPTDKAIGIKNAY